MSIQIKLRSTEVPQHRSQWDGDHWGRWRKIQEHSSCCWPLNLFLPVFCQPHQNCSSGWKNNEGHPQLRAGGEKKSESIWWSRAELCMCNAITQDTLPSQLQLNRMKMYFALGFLSPGKPWGILVKDVENICITTSGLLKQERIKCILVLPQRQGRARSLSQHIPFPILRDSSGHSRPESHSHRLSLQPQTSVPQAADQRQKDSSPTDLIHGRIKAGSRQE